MFSYRVIGYAKVMLKDLSNQLSQKEERCHRFCQLKLVKNLESTL